VSGSWIRWICEDDSVLGVDMVHVWRDLSIRFGGEGVSGKCGAVCGVERMEAEPVALEDIQGFDL
jgi:hypothetical protein